MSLFRQIHTASFVRVLLAALAAASCALPLRPAQAGAYTFSNTHSQRTINAGIVVLDSTTNTATSNTTMAGPDNPDPYVFYILSRRVDLLPPGWTIQNPLASHNIAADVQTRWNARTDTSYSGTVPSGSINGTTFAANNGGQAYQFGQNVTPAMAPYWEVPLATVSPQDLQQFDILLVNLGNSNAGINDMAKFRPTEVEKLRRFVDGGGTLLVEDNGGGQIVTTMSGTSSYGPLFFSPFQYQSGASGTAYLSSLQYRHAILNVPYYLAQNELNALGNHFTGDTIQTRPPDFTSVLADTANDIVVAAKSYGAGAVVISSTGTMAAINDSVTSGSIATAYGPNSGPYSGTNFQAAPTQDLKFLCDIISWSGGHSHEFQNSHQTGETLSAIPSPVRTWNYTPPSGSPTLSSNAPGATLDGSFVYSVDSNGTLHAFDLYPYEDLDGNGNPDDGNIDYIQGSSYDEVWNTGLSSKMSYSAPTIANIKSAVSVFVEGQDGTVKGYKGAQMSAQSVSGFTGPSSGGSFSTNYIPGTVIVAPPPAPAFYDNHLYASEPDGSLFVYDFTTGRSASGGASVKLVDSAGSPAIPNGAPMVGTLPSTGAGDATTPQETDIVAMVPTKSGLLSVFLGARGEQLMGTATTFIAGHLPTTGTIDTGPYPAASTSPTLPAAYTLTTTTAPTNGYANLESGLIVQPSSRTFSGTTSTSPATVFADYDADFSASAGLTRTLVGYGIPLTSGVTSTPALDRLGNACFYTSELPAPDGTLPYNVLSSFHDAPRNARLPWRFRLPSTGEAITDADGTDYTLLEGFTFQGTPVVDSRGFVYALARSSDGNQSAILCINGLNAVTTAPLATDVGTASLVQSNSATGQNEFGGAPSPLLSTQYSQDGTGGPLTLSNFGATTGGVPAPLTPNLNEPEPITVSPAQVGATNGAASQLLLHTNLAWYSILKINGANIPITLGEGIAKVGSSLFFVGGTQTSHLYSVPSDPQAAGYVIANKNIDTTITANQSFVTDSGDTGAGATSAVASGGNGALIVNGTNGVTAYLNRTTLVTDSSRVMELNQDGSASWLVDSTQANAGLGVTSLEINRPSSITELTPNDYLIADTGNNRCVRFDRAGKVVWELSRFTDTIDPLSTANYGKTGPLLSASEPSTLNQPTSVQIRQTVENDGTNNYNVVHYLVSDTGNYRVLDIVDIYDANGNPVGTPHNLVWISHTHDKQQRDYRYESAAYFNAPNGTSTYVVALVTNRRVAQPPANVTAGALSAAAQDAPGGSIVLLNYQPSVPATNGYIATVIDHFQAYIKNDATFDLSTALVNAGANTPSFTGGTPTTLYLRNPRYLKAYIPAGSSSTTKGPNLLLADDNGVWDLAFDASTQQYFTQWGYTQADYQALANRAGPQYPTPVPLVPYNRTHLPFVPQSIQRTATDQVLNGTSTYSIGRYVVVNGFSLGNVANLTDNSAFGGEVFELAVPSVSTGGPSTLATDLVNSLSRLSNTGPLTQPTFAYRLQ